MKAQLPHDRDRQRQLCRLTVEGDVDEAFARQRLDPKIRMRHLPQNGGAEPEEVGEAFLLGRERPPLGPNRSRRVLPGC